NGSAFVWNNPSGTVTAPTGSGVWHITSGTPDAAASKGTAAQIYITNSGATDTGWVSESGDATITATGAVTNAKVNGVSYPAGGALVTGNSAYVSGVSAVTYSALNLGGGAGWVTGTLPAGNQASQTVGGDASGTLSWAASSGTSVTGTGLWYSATGALNSAAVGLSGDATIGTLVGGALPLTLANSGVTAGTYGNTSTAIQIIVDAKGRVTGASQATVAAPLTNATGTLAPSQFAPSGTNGQVLTTVAGSTTWAALPSLAGDVGGTIGANVVNKVS